MENKNIKKEYNYNKKFICSICGKISYGYGNNPWPVVKDLDAECCDECNTKYVIPARIKKYTDSMEV